ncbi:hypothetical protein GF352_01835|nr:hypothetical protein [archaeon]
MVSRILGFALGLLFVFLGIVPFFINMMPAELGNAVTLFYTSYTLGPISVISVIFFLIGVFCLQSAIRDTWPFFG